MKQRVASVDIFRALTMLTMLWVNDFAGMKGIPHWLCHAQTTEDMLGFSDLVFPAFLFCMGMSIPYAVRNRYSKGDSDLKVLLHIIFRTLALVIMGVFSMNMAGVEGGLSHQVFVLTAVAAYFLIWNVYPKGDDGSSPWWSRLLKWTGALTLITLVIYKDLNGMPFKTGWWGILGLIGWSYLACSLIFIFTKGRFRSLVIGWLAVILLCIVNQLPIIPKEFSCRAIVLGFYPGGWTHVALSASGMLVSALLIKASAQTDEKKTLSTKRLIPTFIGLGAVMFVCGLICHNFWIISKNLATPTWFFFCTAIFFPLFALIFWIADIKGKTGWARIIAPAGTATLTCYTIPYIWYAVQQLLGLHYPAALTYGATGLMKSLVFSFAIIGITLLLGKCHIKMKL